MAWYCHYLPNFNLILFNWTVVVLWSFELIYIALQASKGQLSHYNLSTPVYTILYGLMAIAATVVTLYTAYVGFYFSKMTSQCYQHITFGQSDWALFSL
jgi:hypothetical protein